MVDVGKQELPDGKEIPLPPVLLGQLGNDPKKKMVCMYGHLDVQPAFRVSHRFTTGLIIMRSRRRRRRRRIYRVHNIIIKMLSALV